MGRSVFYLWYTTCPSLSLHSLCSSLMENFAERRYNNLTARKVALLLLQKSRLVLWFHVKKHIFGISKRSESLFALWIKLFFLNKKHIFGVHLQKSYKWEMQKEGHNRYFVSICNLLWKETVWEGTGIPLGTSTFLCRPSSETEERRKLKVKRTIINDL